MIYILVVLIILLILVVDCNTTSNTGTMINTINDPNIVLDFPPLALILTDNNMDNSSKHDTKTITTNNNNGIDTTTTATTNNSAIDTKTTDNNNNNVTTGIIRGEIWGLSTMKGIFLLSLK